PATDKVVDHEGAEDLGRAREFRARRVRLRPQLVPRSVVVLRPFLSCSLGVRPDVEGDVCILGAASQANQRSRVGDLEHDAGVAGRVTPNAADAYPFVETQQAA